MRLSKCCKSDFIYVPEDIVNTYPNTYTPTLIAKYCNSCKRLIPTKDTINKFPLILEITK
jgi:hypothetical protein